MKMAQCVAVVQPFSRNDLSRRSAKEAYRTVIVLKYPDSRLVAQLVRAPP
jgi:hypothetical protein